MENYDGNASSGNLVSFSPNEIRFFVRGLLNSIRNGKHSLFVCLCVCELVCAILWAGTPNILLYTLFGSRTEQRPHQQRRGRHRRGCLCHRSWLSISLARRGGQKIAGQEAT